MDVLETAIKTVKLLIDYEDEQIHNESLCTIFRIAQISDHYIQIIIDSDLVRYALTGLESANELIQGSSVRILGVICSGSSSQTQYLLNSGLLDKLVFIKDSENPSIRKDFC